MKKKLLFLITVLLFSLLCQAQFSKTHYIPPLSNSDLQEPHNQTLYISCPSITPISFQIQEIGGATISGTVSRDIPYVYDIGTGFDTQLLISRSDVGTIKNNKGYIVQAQDLVYVTVRLTSSQNENQAGGIVSKGNAALGTQFRIGAFVNTFAPATNANHYTFATILATENNTEISFGDIKPGVQLINNTAAGNTPPNIFLNAGQSYAIAVEGPTVANKDGLIGASISSTKPIVVNCGSFAGSNGTTTNIDLGFDQIVSAERTGKEYIFIKGSGVDEVERPLIVANENGTDVFLNGSTTPYTTLSSGQYLVLDGSSFSANGNLYINTSKNVFAYQGIGGGTSQANQNMQFLPPLSCQTPKTINNIPFINQVGALTNFTGTVCIVTKTGATLNFIIDGTNYTLTTLPTAVNGPYAVIGNPNYVTYTFDGLTGNISVFSSKEVYLSYYGSSGAATYGGFYSGFTFKPEITFQNILSSQSNCIPNVELSVNSITGFDTFQWYYNGNPIIGANSSNYSPTSAIGSGYYKVKATLSTCGIDIFSDEIPVSNCPTDIDNDGIIDNIDLDNDNDGITNCIESYGNKNFNFANLTAGTISINNYSNSYTGAVTFTGTGTPQTVPITGDTQGNFVSETAVPKNNSVLYTLSNFAKPLSISIEYPTTAIAADLLTAATEIRITCPVNKTITILNPNNQLLIDTNYDGVFESGVTQFSSFEIRFRLNGVVPLAAGSGTFSIRGYLINSLIIQNLNISDLNSSRLKLHLTATCIPKDSDNDGIPDQIDLDSDNDGIPDFIEAQGRTILAFSTTDLNQDGIYDMFGTGIAPADSDSDGIPNYLDLDSDNDGIYDLKESGSTASDSNLNGIIDGANFGTNGLAASVQTAPNSGLLNYTIADTNADGVYNYVELDSDKDLCLDVVEAGYLDGNNDGLLGSLVPPTVNANGLVTSGSGYTIPNNNYIIAAPISISNQPQNKTVCELQTATFSVTSNTVTSYQWEISTNNGSTWTALLNNATYSNVTTATLTISNVSPAMTGNQYRVFLNKTGNSCGLYSAAGKLTTHALPVITTPITLKQCDDNSDGISIFNLTQKNDVISANYLIETFTYFTTLAAANVSDNAFKISNPIAYTSGNSSVYARVENSNGCFVIAQIVLIVSVTQIPPGFVIPNQYKCDDFIDAAHNDRDGVSSFNFSPITASLLAILPSNVTVKYYKTEADFLAETDASGISLAISNPSNYRNIGFPNMQTIWVRVDSTVDNSCFGFKTFDIIVEALPVANPINSLNLIRHCDDNQDGMYGFDTATIQSTILNGQTGVNVKYFRANGTQLSSPLPNPFQVNGTETITIKVSNNTTQTGGTPCYDDETLQFIVDDLPQAFPIAVTKTSFCDDEPNPVDQDGFIDFNTTGFQSTILGSQTGMLISYTLQNGTVLSQLPNPFRTKTQNVLVTVTNPINTMCTATYTIPFIVNPTPKIDQKETIVICLPDIQTYIDGGILDGSSPSNYQYQWYMNGIIMTGITSSTLLVNNVPNVYSVDVTNAFGCSKTREITVTGSQIASILNIDVVDLADINSILVTVTGSGKYQFAIDDINGPYQDGNLFTNVPMGIHEIYVRDSNGCGTIGPITIPVLGIPHYFTPNGDGYNDYWNVKGVNAQFNYLSKILIFDRFGKLLKQIGTTGPGWDGTYNGNMMPADDYWYSIQFEDGRSAKGHFALKR